MKNSLPTSAQETASKADATGLRADRVLGVVLILLQLVVLGMLSGARAFPIVMAAVTLWGLRTRLRLRIETIPRNLIYAVTAIGFLLHYMFAPYPLAVDSQFIRSSLAHSLARLLICVQVMQLFLHHPSDRLPIWLAACGAVALSLATNLRAPPYVHVTLLGVIAAFIGSFALYGSRARLVAAGSSRPGWLRRLVTSCALLLVLLLGTGSSWALQKHDRDIEWFLSEYLGYSGGETRAGFTPTGRLESVSQWRTDGADHIVLRIFSRQAPGYLRGAVFDIYHGFSYRTSFNTWGTSLNRHQPPRAHPTRNSPTLRPGDVLYEVSPDERTPGRVLDVWPDESSRTNLFLPLGTRTLAISDADMQMDAGGAFRLVNRIYPLPYFVTANPIDDEGRDYALQKISQADRSRLTSLQAPVDESVRRLAKDLFADCRSPQEKIAAVQRYFRSHYQYRLGIKIPDGTDPVTYFLTQRPAAHCEYFATGTAVLLRLADVPCRYVVGYVAAEWNEVGGFWVARQKDAHAWVEAYDEQVGKWVIVESTPSAGVPQPRKPGYTAQLADSIRQRLNIWRMTLREYGLKMLSASLVQVMWSIPGLIVLLGILFTMLFQYRPRLSARRRRERIPGELKPMHRVLSQLDRQARRQGFQRAPDETLSRFAHRLRESNTNAVWNHAAADCYLLYADLRYRGQTGPEAICQLQQATTRIPTATPRQKEDT